MASSSGTPSVIPGLVRAAYCVGLCHCASVTEDGVYFEWRARGSSVYSVTARGLLRCEGETFSGLEVDCSCPDGLRQKLISLQRGAVVVCKHGASALKSVEDPDAIAAAESQAKRRKTEAVEQARKTKEERAMQRQLQDVELPGERERIAYGLQNLSAEQVVRHLSATTQSLDGLRKLVAVFPESVMPKPALKHCVRCNADFDMQYSSQRVCRVQHPDQAVRRHWDGSKKSWDECARCGKTFNCDGMHSWDRRAVEDEGPWCFEGEHTMDEAIVAEEGWDCDDYG